MADSDRQGSKPYKTYKAGRGKRRALDDELAGRAPGAAAESAGSRTRKVRARTATVRAPTRAYQVYGAPSAAGRGDKRPAGAPTPRSTGGASAGGRSRSPSSSCSSSPASSSPSSPGPATRSSHVFGRGANRRHRQGRRRQRTRRPERARPARRGNGWIWRKGTTLLALRRRQQGRRTGALGTDHVVMRSTRARTPSTSSRSLATRTCRCRARGSTKINEATVLGRAVRWRSDGQHSTLRHRCEPRL